MNFISTFDELNKLYENASFNKALKEDWYGADSEVEFETSVYPDIAKYFGLDPACEVLYAYYFVDEVTVDYRDAAGRRCQIDEHVPLHQVEEWFKAGYYITEANKQEASKACKEELTEAAEDEEIEIVDDEAAVEEIPAEEPIAEEEPKQVICECDKCGALVIMDEANIVVDEESDLVNVEDECQFCEEAKGFKIIGVVAPYEAADEEDAAEAEDNDVVEEPAEEEVPAEEETPAEE